MVSRSLREDIDCCKIDIERIIRTRLTSEGSRRVTSRCHLVVTHMRSMTWNYFLWDLHLQGYTPVCL